MSEEMIDVTNQPTDLVRLWPPYLQNKKEMLEIARIAGIRQKKFQQETNKVYHNRFVMTADEDGLARYEKIYNIQVRNDSTIEDRRLEILTKMQTRTPYTKRLLNQLLKSLLGEGNYTLDIQPKQYTVEVTVELKRKNQVNSVAALLRRVIPANMGYEIQVRYNQYYMLTKMTYAELQEYKYNELMESPEIRQDYLDAGGTII